MTKADWIERTTRAEIRKAEFLAAYESCKAMIGSTPGFIKRTFDSSGFSAECIFISASAVIHRVMMKGNQDNELAMLNRPGMIDYTPRFERNFSDA